MPSIASITVKKKDGTTDIVYDALSGSGGDGSPAVFRQDTGASAGLPVGLRNLLRVWGVWNGPKTARVMKFHFVAPYATQDSTTTLYSAKDRVTLEITATIPQAIPSAQIGESVYQGLNLAAATLIKQSFDAGYAMT